MKIDGNQQKIVESDPIGALAGRVRRDGNGREGTGTRGRRDGNGREGGPFGTGTRGRREPRARRGVGACCPTRSRRAARRSVEPTTRPTTRARALGRRGVAACGARLRPRQRPTARRQRVRRHLPRVPVSDDASDRASTTRRQRVRQHCRECRDAGLRTQVGGLSHISRCLTLFASWKLRARARQAASEAGPAPAPPPRPGGASADAHAAQRPNLGAAKFADALSDALSTTRRPTARRQRVDNASDNTLPRRGAAHPGGRLITYFPLPNAFCFLETARPRSRRHPRGGPSSRAPAAPRGRLSRRTCRTAPKPGRRQVCGRVVGRVVDNTTSDRASTTRRQRVRRHLPRARSGCTNSQIFKFHEIAGKRPPHAPAAPGGLPEVAPARNSRTAPRHICAPRRPSDSASTRCPMSSAPVGTKIHATSFSEVLGQW